MLGLNGLQLQITHLQTITGPHLVDDPVRHRRDDTPEPDRNDERRSPRERSQGRKIHVVQVTVADENRRESLEHSREHGRYVTPDDTRRQVAEQWIREHAYAVDVDEDGRVAEERQSIAYLVSSDAACYSVASTMVTDPEAFEAPHGTAMGIERSRAQVA